MGPLKSATVASDRGDASGSDDKASLPPALKFSLEQALEYIQGDEFVEVTPKSIRLRKTYLNENERKRFSRDLQTSN